MEGASINEILNKYGTQISADTKSAIQNKSVTKYGTVNASGNLAASVRYEVKGATLNVLALGYAYYVEKGRKPGKRPPIKAIEQWITDKGLILENISKKSLAYLIAKKIGEEGTEIYKQHGSKLIEDILSPELRGNIQSDLVLTFRETTNAMMRSAILGK